jgi:NAD(P)-dependent dehydrogenase (short-subunit alcohol dehydrogenase family)
MERFKDKVAIVLGASDAKSMGGVIARRLTQEGAKVVVAARRPEQVDELARSLGAGGITCDIAVEAQLAALAELAITRFGRLDVAVNCAGEAIMGGIAATEESVLRRATDIHFIGPFLFIKQMAAQMGKGGSIVSISSITASLLFPNHAAYMGAKAGTDHLIRIAAVEYGPRGIKVNSVSPGFTESPMTAGFLAIAGVREAFEREIPLGRLNTVDDVAAAVLWVSSEDAFMTGQNLHPSGGNNLTRLPVIAL